MNKDQTYNLIQKLVVLAAGGLIAKGIGDSSAWEDAGGTIAAFVTWFISHKWNAAPVPTPTDPPKTPPMSLGGALHLVFIGAICAGMFAACTMNQQKIAANSLYTLEQATTGTVDGYDTLVIQGNLPTNDVPRVSKLYDDFQAAWLLALDGVRYNSNAIAPPALVVESQDIVNLITTLKTKGTK